MMRMTGFQQTVAVFVPVLDLKKVIFKFELSYTFKICNARLITLHCIKIPFIFQKYGSMPFGTLPYFFAWGTMCSAGAERDAPLARNVAFDSDVRCGV